MAVVGKYIFSGTLGSSEVFAYSWAFTHPTWTNASQAVGAGAVWMSRWLSVNGGAIPFAPHVVHNNVRAVCYNVDGSTQSAFSLNVTPIPGGSTASPNSLPFEVACAVTLRTAVNSRRGRGRFYLPPPVREQVSGQGLFASVVFATGAGSWIEALREAFQHAKDVDGVTPGVITRAAGGVTMNPLTSIEIGNIPDAQRRRRNRQVESRITASIT